MRLPPIVDRELRVSARRRGIYWTRAAVALWAIIVAACIVVAEVRATQSQLGQHIFYGLSGLLMLYCLVVGRRSTVDCLTEEKREGTLGLLFLTDLKGHDVVLGKLAATSLGSFYGLLSVVPVLALPLLLGGVANAEFWRMVLVLVNTFLFSLAVGIFWSAVCRDTRHAAAGNFLTMLAFVLGVPSTVGLLAYLQGGWSSPLEWSLLPCPLYSFSTALDVLNSVRVTHFWWSVAVIHALAWMFILLASRIIPRTWQDRPLATEAARGRGFWHALKYGPARKQAGFRRRLLNVNAFYWLASRARLKPLHVWLFLSAMVVWWIWVCFESNAVVLSEEMSITATLIAGSALKLWIAIEAGQTLAEDRKAGALELVLSTPLGVGDIVRGQFRALRRQFLGPMIAVIAIELLFLRTTILNGPLDWHEFAGGMIGAAIMLVADAIALSWVAMRNALTTRNPNYAVLAVIGRILVLPWIAYGVIVLTVNLWLALTYSSWTPSWSFYFGCWFGLGLAADLFFGLKARAELLGGFRQLASEQFARKSGARLKELVAKSRMLVEAPAKAPRRLNRRRLAFAFLIVLVAMCTTAYFRNKRPAYPPPILVSLSASNTPLEVVSGTGVFFVMPDGSLWQWGRTAGFNVPLIATPQPFGTNHNWKRAVSSMGTCVGMQSDGTIWEWGNGGLMQSHPFSEPILVDSGRDWKFADLNGVNATALRADGSLWSWGYGPSSPLYNGSGRGITRNNPQSPNTLSPVGADRDWVSLSCAPAATMAVRSDGTLWVWGRIHKITSMTPRSYGNIELSSPQRVCQESNWSQPMPGIPLRVWTRSGELWDFPFQMAPGPARDVDEVGRLIVSNSAPERVAFGFVGGQNMYAQNIYLVRNDGTLWQAPYSFLNAGSPVTGPWTCISSRHDWTRLWSGSGTVFGLTADGTLWTWGVDHGKESPATRAAAASDSSLQTTLRDWLNQKSGTPGRSGPMPPVVREPRPLLKLIYTDSNQPAM